MNRATPEDFVRAWEKAESAREVDDLFNQKHGWAACRAVRYRKSGVRLKRFIGKWEAIAEQKDYLNRIIDDGKT